MSKARSPKEIVEHIQAGGFDIPAVDLIEVYGRQKKISGARQLAKRVKQMRDQQKLYFQTRDRERLKESKRLEKLVDQAVEAILK